MVITEDFFMLFLKLFALEFFLHGFTVSSYQQPLLTGSSTRELTTATKSPQ